MNRLQKFKHTIDALVADWYSNNGYGIKVTGLDVVGNTPQEVQEGVAYAVKAWIKVGILHTDVVITHNKYIK
jgi:hypothetical protein